MKCPERILFQLAYLVLYFTVVGLETQLVLVFISMFLKYNSVKLRYKFNELMDRQLKIFVLGNCIDL